MLKEHPNFRKICPFFAWHIFYFVKYYQVYGHIWDLGFRVEGSTNQYIGFNGVVWNFLATVRNREELANVCREQYVRFFLQPICNTSNASKNAAICTQKVGQALTAHFDCVFFHSPLWAILSNLLLVNSMGLCISVENIVIIWKKHPVWFKKKTICTIYSVNHKIQVWAKAFELLKNANFFKNLITMLIT